MSPRTQLVACGGPPTKAALDLPEFQADFEALLARHGVTVKFAGEETRKNAPALLALAAASFGAACDLPKPVFDRFAVLRARVGAVPCAADVEVA